MSSATSPAARRSEFADAVTVLLFAAAALVVTGVATALRIAETFRDDAIAWTLPIDEQPVSATTGSGATRVDGIASEVTVLATGVDAGSVAAVVGSVALSALTAVVVISAVLVVAWNFLRGRIFRATNARALDVIGWTLVLAPLLIVLLDTLGRNGVLTALGLGEGEPAHPIAFWAISPLFATGVTVGLIAVALRRGGRLQQENQALADDTRGLV